MLVAIRVNHQQFFTGGDGFQFYSVPDHIGTVTALSMHYKKQTAAFYIGWLVKTKASVVSSNQNRIAYQLGMYKLRNQ